MKAVFIFNFIKYIEWPENRTSGPFIIAILGRSRITPFLSLIATKKKVNGRAIIVHEIERGDTAKNAHVLFIDSGAVNIAEVFPHLSDLNLLVVTDKENAARNGAGICFYIENGRVKFEINRKNIQNADLFVSSRLLRLASIAE